METAAEAGDEVIKSAGDAFYVGCAGYFQNPPGIVENRLKPGAASAGRLSRRHEIDGPPWGTRSLWLSAPIFFAGKQNFALDPGSNALGLFRLNGAFRLLRCNL